MHFGLFVEARLGSLVPDIVGLDEVAIFIKNYPFLAFMKIYMNSFVHAEGVPGC